MFIDTEHHFMVNSNKQAEIFKFVLLFSKDEEALLCLRAKVFLS